MKAIIVGGGKVGYYLLKTLMEKGYKVIMIEKNMKICEKVAEELNVEVICGDGTDINILRDAEVENAKIAAAVTGHDEENFVICQTIKNNYEGIDTIARVNNPKNQEVFKALGVDNTVCSTEVISNLIEIQLCHKRVRVLQSLNNGNMFLVEMYVDKKSNWKNKAISALSIPNGCVIVSIFRNGNIVFPKGSIEIKEQDRVLVTVSTENKLEFEKSL